MREGQRLPGVDERQSKTPIVLHVDADCFYAACERLREPKLVGEPVVVGMGYEPGDSVGAVATASYEARAYGVESAMAISTALDRLPRRDESESIPSESTPSETDPSATDDRSLSQAETDSANRDADRTESTEPATESATQDTGYYRPVDLEFYESVATEVKAILHESADVVREVSIDEAYLDVTDRTAWEVADGFARHVKDRIRREVGITVSIGVAPTMSAAKIASDFDKPDGLTVVEPGSVREFLAPLSVELLHGVGPVTARELRSMGLETAGDVADADRDVLIEAFGERGRELHDQARGRDDRRVTPMGRPKSFSRESAFAEAITDPDPKYDQLETLAGAVAARAQREGALYRTIGVKAVTPPYEVNTREQSLSGPVDDPELVETIARELFSEFESEPVRKLGVRVANLEFTTGDQSSLDSWDDDSTQTTADSRTTGRRDDPFEITADQTERETAPRASIDGGRHVDEQLSLSSFDQDRCGSAETVDLDGRADSNETTPPEERQREKHGQKPPTRETQSAVTLAPGQTTLSEFL